MIKVCPLKEKWHEVYEQLLAYAESHDSILSKPPVPLILSGWWYTNDIEKMKRWNDTILWAMNNNCQRIVDIPEEHFYYVEKPTSYAIGPLGSPMYNPWTFDSKERPSTEEIFEYLKILTSYWKDIAGLDLAKSTKPITFTGLKARRLLVEADAKTNPPWGSWFELSIDKVKRRTFTRFRSAVNKAIAPHEVDHIGFKTCDNFKEQ